MEKFACTLDYERYAKKMLSPPMFSFITGPDHVTDSEEYLSIQLKLRGLANLKYFTDPISTTLLGQKVASPICLGPSCH